VVELFGDILSEGVTCSSRRDTPSTSIIGIGPKEVTNGALMRNFHNSIELLDLVKSVD
jgi:hypothetical protein